jgi:spore coat protein CotF
MYNDHQRHRGMTDRDIAETALGMLKHAVTCTATAALECSNPELRTDCSEILNRSLDNHYHVWRMMHNRGWYDIEPASHRHQDPDQRSKHHGQEYWRQ